MKTKDALAIGIKLGRLQRTVDAWEENKHPRAKNGQFSHSAGGGSGSQSTPSSKTKGTGSITVEEMKAARLRSPTGQPAVLADKWGDPWFKIGEDKWERHSSNPHVSNSVKTSQELWDRNEGNLKDYNEYRLQKHKEDVIRQQKNLPGSTTNLNLKGKKRQKAINALIDLFGEEPTYEGGKNGTCKVAGVAINPKGELVIPKGGSEGCEPDLILEIIKGAFVK